MYAEVLDRIRSRLQEYEEELQPPCSESSLRSLREQARSVLGCGIPHDYEEFLRLTNGLVWNGLTIYASERSPIIDSPGLFIDGFVEANCDYRESGTTDDLLIFGQDGVVFYVQDLTTGDFNVILMVGDSVMEKHESLSAMLVSAMKSRLD